jgi:hypothetical protein
MSTTCTPDLGILRVSNCQKIRNQPDRTEEVQLEFLVFKRALNCSRFLRGEDAP